MYDLIKVVLGTSPVKIYTNQSTLFKEARSIIITNFGSLPTKVYISLVDRNVENTTEATEAGYIVPGTTLEAKEFMQIPDLIIKPGDYFIAYAENNNVNLRMDITPYNN